MENLAKLKRIVKNVKTNLASLRHFLRIVLQHNCIYIYSVHSNNIWRPSREKCVAIFSVAIKTFEKHMDKCISYYFNKMLTIAKSENFFLFFLFNISKRKVQRMHKDNVTFIRRTTRYVECLCHS